MGVFLKSFVISGGQTDSTVLEGRILRTIRSLAIHGPATLTGTITLQAADDLVLGSYTTVQSGGSDVTVVAGKVVVITDVPFGTLRLQSGASEGGERTFVVTGEENPHV